jgi:hypothetical protein
MRAWLGRILLLVSLPLAAARAAEPAQRTELDPALAVVAAELQGLWADAGPAVHAPPALRALVPGQRLAVAVIAAGPDAEALLRGATFTLRLRCGKAAAAQAGRPAAVVKRGKASGRERALAVLRAGGVSGAELERVDRATTSAAVALVEMDWVAPEVKEEQAVVVEGEATLPDGARLKLDPAQLPLLPWRLAAGRGRVDELPADDQGRWMLDYARRPEPQHLAELLRAGVAAAESRPDTGARENGVAFVAWAIEVAPPGAGAALAEAVAKDPVPVRQDAAVALRWAGKDAAALVAALPPAARAEVEAAPRRPDPYPLDTSFETLRATPHRMDLLWSEFMATGRARPVRAIAELLRFRDDLPALEEYRAAADKAPLLPRVAHAVLYRTAGWSLASFAAQETLVADYVDRWAADPETSAILREELRGLLTNEAFRQAGK